MSSSIAALDLTTLTDYQRDLHIGKNNEPITSHLFRVFRKSTWNAHIPIKMKSTITEKIISFECAPNFHTLLYSHRSQYFPSIRVKEEHTGKVRICWCYNLGLNSISTGKFYVGGEVRQTFDNVSLDSHFQFSVAPEKRKDFDIDVGNVPEMNDWTELLPEYTTDVADPWMYNQDEEFSRSFPLYLAYPIHEYTMRNEIKDLLRMQQKNDKGEWVNIKCNLALVDIAAVDKERLTYPELYGRFNMMDTSEFNWSREFFKKNEEHLADFPDGEYTYWYHDFIPCESLNADKMGQNQYVPLSSNGPVRAMYITAENLKATAINNRSNYTTDVDDTNGNPPINTITYSYSTSKRLENVGWNQLSRIEPRHHCVGRPVKNGYGVISHAYKISSLDADVGIVFDNPKNSLKASLIVNLKENNPFNKFNPVEQNNDNLYQIHVRLYTTRKLTIKCKNQTEPYTYEVSSN